MILSLPTLALLAFIGNFAWFYFDINAPNRGWEFGCYGQFNRIKNVIDEMPGVQIVDFWQHEDLELEDFGFTLRLENGDEVQVRYHDDTPEKNERNRHRIRIQIQNAIDSTIPSSEPRSSVRTG